MSAFFESDRFKRIKNLIIGVGASVVLIGALFKIMHWEGADFMLMVGMLTEAVLFLMLGILPPHKDYYWEKFTEDGEESMCGWLKDKFGVSWQIIPAILGKIMSDSAKAGKAAQAFMSMRKLNIEQIVQSSIS